jgi:multidrug resistance efflux pump
MFLKRDFFRHGIDAGKLEIRQDELQRQSGEPPAAEATWKQLEEELELQQKASQAELRGLKLEVATQQNHLGRHVRDVEQMTVTTPVPGLVVMETNFRGGQFSQVETGDQVYPQTLFM